MKKLLALLLAAVMCMALLAGCGKDEGSVYWLNFKPESDEVLQEIAKMYTEETGVEVKVVTAASGTYNETLIAEMDKSEAPTLFVAGNAAAVESWGEYCYDLKDTEIAKELNTDAYMLYDDEGKLCSMGEAVDVAASVSSGGLVDYHGTAEGVNDTTGGIRPAMWLNLEK